MIAKKRRIFGDNRTGTFDHNTPLKRKLKTVQLSNTPRKQGLRFCDARKHNFASLKKDTILSTSYLARLYPFLILIPKWIGVPKKIAPDHKGAFRTRKLKYLLKVCRRLTSSLWCMNVGGYLWRREKKWRGFAIQAGFGGCVPIQFTNLIRV